MENEIVCADIDKTYCKLCKQKMIQIPIRRINSLIMVEHYCPDCDKSEITYENFEHM